MNQTEPSPGPQERTVSWNTDKPRSSCLPCAQGCSRGAGRHQGGASSWGPGDFPGDVKEEQGLRVEMSMFAAAAAPWERAHPGTGERPVELGIWNENKLRRHHCMFEGLPGLQC